MDMELKTLKIFHGEKKLNFEYEGAPKPQLTELNLVEDVVASLEFAKNIFILALARLNDNHESVVVRVDAEVFPDQPEENRVIWVFSVIGFDGNIVTQYQVTDIVDCIAKSTKNINSLVSANPMFEDKQYLADVGIEQALAQYSVTL